MRGWARRLFGRTRCERCNKPAVGFAVMVRPRPATEAGKPATDLVAAGPSVALCREHLESFREDPDRFG